MITVYYTPPGYRDSTRMLWEEALRIQSGPRDYSPILYLAPTAVKAHEAQKLFHQVQGDACYIPPEIATIGSYCKRLYAASGSGRLIPRTLIPVLIAGLTGKGLGFASVIADFIHELKQHFPGKPSLQQEFSGMIEALNIPEPVAARIMEALETFRAYQSFIGEKGFVDDDDTINACPHYGYALHKGGILILDGFYDPSDAEKRVLSALIGNAERVFVSVPHDAMTKDYRSFLRERFQPEEHFVSGISPSGPAGSPQRGPRKVEDFPGCERTYYSYADSEEEVEGIARQIKLLYVSGKITAFEGTIVAFPGLHQYAPIVERVFTRYGLPFSFIRKKNLGDMRPFREVLCLLNAVCGDYPRLQFAQFLASKYFKRMPGHLNKWIATLSLGSGIVTGKTAWREFLAEGSEVLDLSLLPERSAIGRELEWIFKKLLPLEEIKGGAGYTLYSSILQKLLDDLGFIAASDEETKKRVTEALQEIFEQLSFLGTLCPSPVTLAEFGETLRHFLNAAVIESEETGVMVMDFLDLQGLIPDYLFFGGLVDGVIPERQKLDYLLPDSAKVRMGLLHLEKYILVQKFIFESALRSAGHLYLSYPAMDGDAVSLPSSFLYSGEGVKGGIAGIFSKEELLVRQRQSQLLLDIIGEIRIPSSLLTPPAAFRITDVDAYRACPRRFFIERLLKLTPADIKEYTVEAATLGTIIHKVMERLIKELSEEHELNDDLLRLRAEAIISDSISGRRVGEYWKQLVSDTFLELLPEILEKERAMREEGYRCLEVEKNISGEPVKGIRLKGKIDRIDTNGAAVQIIDYKTGAATLNCAQALAGNENLQLFLYAAMLKSYGYQVQRVGIYSIKDVTIKWCPPQHRNKTTLDAYSATALALLEDAVARLRKGDFTARPLNDYQCRNCHEIAFCPYIQQ